MSDYTDSDFDELEKKVDKLDKSSSHTFLIVMALVVAVAILFAR